MTVEIGGNLATVLIIVALLVSWVLVSLINRPK